MTQPKPTKHPPRVHTDFENSEYLIDDLAIRGIATEWSFLKPKDPVNDWLLRGSSIPGKINLYFHSDLFEPELPSPYFSGEEIDMVTAFVISHEAGHILDDTPAKYEVASIPQKKIFEQTKYKRVLILDVERQAWSIGEMLLRLCAVRNPKFDQSLNWGLFNEVRDYCLSTYRKGLRL